MKFLFNCSISSFSSDMAPLKNSYTCSICSLVFRWSRCSEAQLRLCVNFVMQLNIMVGCDVDNLQSCHYLLRSPTNVFASALNLCNFLSMWVSELKLGRMLFQWLRNCGVLNMV